MQITIKTDFAKAEKLLAQLSGPQIRIATAKALTDAAFEARKVVQQDMDRSFDRVTPYIRRSITVKPATPDKLQAIVEPKYQGGKGVDPQNVLRASIFGGERKQKASERALARVGILPSGYSIVPGEACPLDIYGNVKGSFIVQLISYFQAFGEQGYKANMTDRRKANLAKIGRTANGYKTINGVQYFIASGKLRSGRSSHLHAGIWSRTGIHGSNVKPILMFVRTPNYPKRLDFFDKPVAAAMAKFNPRFRYHMRTILEAR
ncbi:MAG: hypothetical protein RL375_790 [Pseudomonadota bacterium]|jgi:hypothetical protein